MPRITIPSMSGLQAAATALRPAVAAPRCLFSLNKTATTARTFSNLPSLRPTTLPSSSTTNNIAFRPFQTPLARLPTTATTTTTTADGEVLDLVSRASISAHPALAGAGVQIRCGPRPTMSGASRLIQKRRHGFLSRIKTKNGRKTLTQRQTKGRKRLSA
ncbi:hypothetical protein B0T17DRAFT_612225 [Bombardia bombarda]|uniref:50S ribosomal protein L34, chloroplastic n=1 Tax=Bombardia bombarda TaxID=252184 RepID=A0AA40CEB8_9PEZI|nr:hypothetical protein B0T17DRAFT_612225 [Bombardia bombarda]